jgi:hypothetical protein
MREQCDSPSVARIARDEVCRVGNPQALPNFVFIGDSFGDALVPGIDAATNRLSKPTAGYALTHSGCFPLPGVEQLSNPSCKGVMDANIAFIKRHPEIRKIVMVARWTSAALGNRFGQFEQSGWVIKDKYSTGQSVNDNKGVMLRSLENLISQFPDRQFIFIAYIPEQQFDVPRKLAFSSEFFSSSYTGVDVRIHQSRQGAVRSIFGLLVQNIIILRSLMWV